MTYAKNIEWVGFSPLLDTSNHKIRPFRYVTSSNSESTIHILYFGRFGLVVGIPRPNHSEEMNNYTAFIPNSFPCIDFSACTPRGAMEIGLLTENYRANNNYYQTKFGLCESSDFLENELGPEHPNLSAMNINCARNKFPDQRTTLHKQNRDCNAQEALHFRGFNHDWSWNFYYKTLNQQPWSYRHPVPDNERQPGPRPVSTSLHRQNCSFSGPYLHSSSAAKSDNLHSHVPRISGYDCLQNETYPPNPRSLPMLPKTDGLISENVVAGNYLTDKTPTAENMAYKDRENEDVSPLNETYLQYIKEFKNDLIFLSQVPNKMSTPYTSPSDDTVLNKLSLPFYEGQYSSDAFADKSADCGIKHGQQPNSFQEGTPKRRVKRAFQSEVEEAVYYLTTKYMKYD
ncbi:hypothetical protein CHS0354_039513 [Potamilus streckersoni]|uniref:Uncharacterized protein n=1 Tax=Potamilus streckersoni TaxID=2493646 RepID=A0AAE0TKT0_9BIVA|nr:hypothetical protein CHS0354_039513 [Potamilus streckersoni]